MTDTWKPTVKPFRVAQAIAKGLSRVSPAAAADYLDGFERRNFIERQATEVRTWDG